MPYSTRRTWTIDPAPARGLSARLVRLHAWTNILAAKPDKVLTTTVWRARSKSRQWTRQSLAERCARSRTKTSTPRAPPRRLPRSRPAAPWRPDRHPKAECDSMDRPGRRLGALRHCEHRVAKPQQSARGQGLLASPHSQQSSTACAHSHRQPSLPMLPGAMRSQKGQRPARQLTAALLPPRMLLDYS